MQKHYFFRLFILSILFFGMNYSAIGQNHYYLDFDGSNDYVYRADNSALDKLNNASSYTIEAWIYISTWKDYQRIVSRYSHWEMYLRENGQLAFRVKTGSSSWSLNYSVNNAVSTGSWQHVAVVRSGGKIHFYVNGINKDAGSYNGYTLPGSSTNDHLYIGRAGSSSNYFNGYIDEVRLKKVAISSANLHCHTYDAEYTSDANTAGLFHFNEGTGNKTKDAAKNINASIYNSPNWRAWNYIPTSILPLSKNTWNGSTSTDWGTATNWSMNALPTSESYVVIANITNQPTIAGATIENCRNIDIDASAVLTIDGTLNIYGNFTNSGSFSAS